MNYKPWHKEAVELAREGFNGMVIAEKLSVNVSQVYFLLTDPTTVKYLEACEKHK